MKRDIALKPKKLSLKKEALRTLGDAELEQVAGGSSAPCISVISTISIVVTTSRTLSRVCQTL